jgi:radical SAM protein (TIGR01212 family)
MEFHRKRYRSARGYLAYFQAYSNTHDNLESLAQKYEEALSVPGIAGLVIGTRPDAVDPEKLDYLMGLSGRTYLVVEYGIESVLNDTLLRVNRGHDVEQSEWAVKETAGRGIRVGGHVIIGLPGEDENDFLNMADVLSGWPLNNIKFHQLQVIRGTAMEQQYKEDPAAFAEFTMHGYLVLMMKVLERLNPSFVVERIAGEVNPGMAVKEGWGMRYDEVLRSFEAMLELNDTWQGKHFNPTVR